MMKHRGIVFARPQNAGLAEGFAEQVMGCARSPTTEYGRYVTAMVLSKVVEDDTVLATICDQYFAVVVKLLETVRVFAHTHTM